MKQSIEENAEGRASDRGEWPATSRAKSSHGPVAKVFQEIKEEQDQKSGEKIKFLSSKPSEKREGHFCERCHGWVFLWPTQHLKRQLLPLGVHKIFSPETPRCSVARINLL